MWDAPPKKVSFRLQFHFGSNETHWFLSQIRLYTHLYSATALWMPSRSGDHRVLGTGHTIAAIKGQPFECHYLELPFIVDDKKSNVTDDFGYAAYRFHFLAYANIWELSPCTGTMYAVLPGIDFSRISACLAKLLAPYSSKRNLRGSQLNQETGSARHVCTSCNKCELVACCLYCALQHYSCYKNTRITTVGD